MGLPFLYLLFTPCESTFTKLLESKNEDDLVHALHICRMAYVVPSMLPLCCNYMTHSNYRIVNAAFLYYSAIMKSYFMSAKRILHFYFFLVNLDLTLDSLKYCNNEIFQYFVEMSTSSKWDGKVSHFGLIYFLSVFRLYFIFVKL